MATPTIPTAEESPTVSAWPIAGKALGIGKDVTYERAATGELVPGVPVLKVGNKYRVPTAALRQALHLDPLAGTRDAG
jgi:hypothetical protein